MKTPWAPLAKLVSSASVGSASFVVLLLFNWRQNTLTAVGEAATLILLFGFSLSIEL